jgi:uncharacterized protein
LAKKSKRRKKNKKSPFPVRVILFIGLLAFITGIILSLSSEGYLGETGHIIGEKWESLTETVSSWQKKIKIANNSSADDRCETDDLDNTENTQDADTYRDEFETGRRSGNSEDNGNRLTQPGDNRTDLSKKQDSNRRKIEPENTRRTRQAEADKNPVTTEFSRRKPVERDPSVPVIAIVIDDFGNSLKNLEDFCQLEIPVTLAVLPKLPYSEKSAKKASESGQEVIMHLPLENYSGKNPGPGTIKTGMSIDEISRSFEESLSTIPGAVGFNNHEGSKATEDEELMQILMKLAKKHNLFYLDSRTSSKSTGFETASREGIPAAKRHVFLDNEDKQEYITEQIQILVNKAKKEGSAVGIGHCRRNTYLAIKEMIPKIREENVEFVFVSELVE